MHRRISWKNQMLKKKSVKYLLTYLVLIVVTLLLFLIIRKMFGGTLIYDQLNLIGVFLFVIIVMAKLLKLIGWRNVYEFGLGILIIILVSQSIFLNIDRSRSFYVLSWIKNYDVSVKHGILTLEKVTSPEGLNKEAILVRIEEQISRGLIRRVGNTFELTRTGEFTLVASEKIAAVFHLEGWLRNAK